MRLSETRRHEIFQQFMPIVAKQAKRYPTLNQQDLTQSGFVKLLALVDLQGEGLTGAFVKTSIKNLFQNELRRAMKEPKTLHGGDDRKFDPDRALEVVAESNAPAPDKYGEVEALIDIDRAFARVLTEKEAQVMDLRWLRGVPVTEAAVNMSTTTKTIQRLEMSALDKLAKMTEFPTLHQQLCRVLLLTAIASGASPEQVSRLSKAAGADPAVMATMPATEAKKHLVSLRKQGY